MLGTAVLKVEGSQGSSTKLYASLYLNMILCDIVG